MGFKEFILFILIGSGKFILFFFDLILRYRNLNFGCSF